MLDLNQAVLASIRPTIAELRAIPLFADLQETDFEQISQGLECRHITPHDYLYRQGQAADSAFFVQSGTLNVVSTLPGGGETSLATVGPGSILGETALVASGVRTASVRAETDVIGFTMERQFLKGSIAQANPVACRILGKLVEIVCQRLHAHYTQLVQLEKGNNRVLRCSGAPGFGESIDDAAQHSEFPWEEYLPRLGFFSRFQRDEINALASWVQNLELPQGTVLFEKGETPVSCYFVVRGALELCIARENGNVPLAVLGPGSFLGTTEIAAGGVRVACGRTREQAVLLEFGTAQLRELLGARTMLALKFQHALCESLITDLGKANKRLARSASGIAMHMQ